MSTAALYSHVGVWNTIQFVRRGFSSNDLNQIAPARLFAETGRKFAAGRQ